MNSQEDSDQRQRRRQKNSTKNKNEASVLLELNKILSQIQDHHKLIQTRFYTKLNLRVIQKKPLYLADKKNCIQAIFKPQKFPRLNPFNQQTNQFYANHPKPQILFNCREQILEQQTPLYPSAYHPAYFYKNYEYFKEKRNQIKILVNCQIVELKCWSIGIVNISKSGYYAPVLIIHDWYKKHNANQNLDKIVQNILFEKKLSTILDQFRVKDMKKFQVQKPSHSFGFAYYIRNHLSIKKIPKEESKFVSLDLKSSLLKTDQKLPINIVPLGNLPQYNLFKRPIPPKYLSERKKINLYKYIQAEQNQQNQNLSQSQSQFQQQYDSNKQQGQIIQTRKIRNQMMNQQEQNLNIQNRIANSYLIQMQSQEEYSDGEDHLKKIYQKVLNGTKFI